MGAKVAPLITKPPQVVDAPLMDFSSSFFSQALVFSSCCRPTRPLMALGWPTWGRLGVGARPAEQGTCPTPEELVGWVPR
jgi:hypothetical protein